MISRNRVETDFMKKKIHFVCDFKLYNPISKEGPNQFQQAMKQACAQGFNANFMQPPLLDRNMKEKSAEDNNLKSDVPGVLSSQRKSLS